MTILTEIIIFVQAQKILTNSRDFMQVQNELYKFRKFMEYYSFDRSMKLPFFTNEESSMKIHKFIENYIEGSNKIRHVSNFYKKQARNHLKMEDNNLHGL